MSCIALIVVKAGLFTALLLGLVAPVKGDVTITQLANEGVLLDDGENRILVDGLVVDRYSVYGGLSGEALKHFQQLTGPFADVDLALASHRHHDHNQPQHACDFMKRSSQTRMITSPQVLGLMRERCRNLVTTDPRIEKILPTYEAPIDLQSDTAKIRVFLLSHGTRKYAKIQNYGHLIVMGGASILHIGDAAMTATDFQRAGLDRIRVDVALVPFWYFQPGPGADIVNQYLNSTLKVAVHIPPGELVEVKQHLTEQFPQVLVLDHPLANIRYQSPESPSIPF